jgi:Zn-finger nucleic acid-binding protein
MSDDRFRGDPYRTAPYRDAPGHEELFRQCPRCDRVLAEYRRVYVCRRGCGVWLPIDLVRETATLADLVACEIHVGPAPARCAQCLQMMPIRRHGGVVFDFCAEHGVWLDRGKRADFEDAVSAERRAAARPERDERAWYEVLLRAPRWLDETMSPEEREERAWLDDERARLDDERG